MKSTLHSNVVQLQNVALPADDSAAHTQTQNSNDHPEKKEDFWCYMASLLTAWSKCDIATTLARDLTTFWFDHIIRNKCAEHKVAVCKR